jgi:hypothetical protein
VRLVLAIGGATGGSGNLSTSLSNVVRLPAHPKFVWVFNVNCDETIVYNDRVDFFFIFIKCKNVCRFGRVKKKLLYFSLSCFYEYVVSCNWA